MKSDNLCGLQRFYADDCRNRYRDPLVTRATYLALCLCWVATRDRRCAVVVCATHVSLVADHTPDGGHPPDGFALWRGDKVLVEPARDLPHRKIALDIVPK